MTSHLADASMVVDAAGMPADDDAAWQDDVRAGVRHVRDLDSLPLSPAERAAAQAAATRHKVRIPKAYLDLIDWSDPADPIRAQVIPSPEELAEQEGEPRRSDRRPCLQSGAAIDASPCRPGSLVCDLSMRGLLPVLFS